MPIFPLNKIYISALKLLCLLVLSQINVYLFPFKVHVHESIKTKQLNGIICLLVIKSFERFLNAVFYIMKYSYKRLLLCVFTQHVMILSQKSRQYLTQCQTRPNWNNRSSSIDKRYQKLGFRVSPSLMFVQRIYISYARIFYRNRFPHRFNELILPVNTPNDTKNVKFVPILKLKSIF